MIEVTKGLWVGAQADYEEKVKGKRGWAVVHACKEPYHRELVGYTTKAAPKGPEYLVARRGERLALNLIDAPHAFMIPPEAIDPALTFITEQRAAGRKVLVHCNQGRSRSPGLAMLWLAKQGHFAGLDVEMALTAFGNEYPFFAPGKGVEGYIRDQWTRYCAPATSAAPAGAPAATPSAPAQPAAAAAETKPKFVPPPNFRPPEELESAWTDDLTEKWLDLNERQQKFLKIWYTNSYNATQAYTDAYGQANKGIASVCGSQLLANPKVVAFREAIWMAQIPPFEKMAQVENEVLDADPATTDPAKYKVLNMKLDAVQKMRAFHRMLPAKKVEHTFKGDMNHNHSGAVDLAGLEGLFNAGEGKAAPTP